MKYKLLVKLGILVLAVIFLAGMSSYSAPQVKIQAKGGVKGKPDKPPDPEDPPADLPEMYTIKIEVIPGLYGFGFDPACNLTNNFVYATPKKGKYLFWLRSDGGLTPGPNGEEARMRMT